MNLELKKLEQRTNVLNAREDRFNAEKVRFLKRVNKLREAHKLAKELGVGDESEGDEDSVYSYEIDALLQREGDLGEASNKSKQAMRQEAIVRAAVLARLSQLVLLKKPH